MNAQSTGPLGNTHAASCNGTGCSAAGTASCWTGRRTGDAEGGGGGGGAAGSDVGATCGQSKSASWACTVTAGPCWLKHGALSGWPSGTAAGGSGPHRSANTAVFSTSSSLMLKSATARYLSSSSTMSAALLVLHIVNSRSSPRRRMLTSASRRLATMLFWCLQQEISKLAGGGSRRNSGARMHRPQARWG